MWTVIKYKINEFKILKENFKKVLGKSPIFYNPKIKYQKYINNKLKTFDKLILENYLLCYHPNFERESIINILKFSKGLEYFLPGFHQNQKEIINFINHCKKYENADGYLKQDFFNYDNFKKCKFISGPFINMIFEIISNQSTKLKILINGLTTVIDKKSNYFYRPV